MKKKLLISIMMLFAISTTTQAESRTTKAIKIGTATVATVACTYLAFKSAEMAFIGRDELSRELVYKLPKLRLGLLNNIAWTAIASQAAYTTFNYIREKARTF